MARCFGLLPASFASGRSSCGVVQRTWNGLLRNVPSRAGLTYLPAGSSAWGSLKSQQHAQVHENLLPNPVAASHVEATTAAAAAMQPRVLPGLSVLLPVAQAAPAAALGIIWLLARPAPATAAAILPRSAAGVAQLEAQLVVMAPEAAAVGSVRPSSNDSMLLIVAVCLGFWMLSATISAGIGAIMKLSGRSLRYATRGAASWTSAGIMDTFDIMRLPLAYEIDEPSRSSKGSSKSSSGGITYVPWDGPEASYIPVNMVKVLRPGFREAGLVAKPSMLQPEKSLSIISVETGSRSKDGTADSAPGMPMNGNGHKSNGSNGRNSSDGGTDKGPPSSSG